MQPGAAFLSIVTGRAECIDDEVWHAQFIIELRIDLQLLRCHCWLDDVGDAEAGGQEGADICRQGPVEIREVDSHHCPMALGFVEVAIQDDVELLLIRRPVPRAHRRPHWMEVRDDESSSRFQNAKYLPVISVDIGQVTLVQVRYGKVKCPVGQETQILYIGDTVLVATGWHLHSRFNHGNAQIEAHDICGSTVCEQSAETTFSTAAVHHAKTLDVPAGLKHWLVEEPRARRIRTLSRFFDPGRGEADPFLIQDFVVNVYILL